MHKEKIRAQQVNFRSFAVTFLSTLELRGRVGTALASHPQDCEKAHLKDLGRESQSVYAAVKDMPEPVRRLVSRSFMRAS